MSKDRSRPGERRRRKGKKKADPKRPRFHRPIAWAMQELIGVKAWLKRLKGSEGAEYPEGWKRGQIKHYEKRARMLRREITETAKPRPGENGEDDEGPKVA